MDNNTVMYIAVFAAIVAVVALIMIWQVRSSLNQSAAPAPAPAPAAAPAGAGESVEAPMPGKVIRINKHVGDAVASGDEVLVLEAMKMGNPIMAPCDGKITGMPVSEGQSVQGGDVLFTVG